MPVTYQTTPLDRQTQDNPLMTANYWDILGTFILCAVALGVPLLSSAISRYRHRSIPLVPCRQEELPAELLKLVTSTAEARHQFGFSPLEYSRKTNGSIESWVAVALHPKVNAALVYSISQVRFIGGTPRSTPIIHVVQPRSRFEETVMQRLSVGFESASETKRLITVNPGLFKNTPPNIILQEFDTQNDLSGAWKKHQTALGDISGPLLDSQQLAHTNGLFLLDNMPIPAVTLQMLK